MTGRAETRTEHRLDPAHQGGKVAMAQQNPDSTTRHTFNVEAIRDANVVATIDFHRTLIYVLGGPGDNSPERIEDVESQGHAQEIAHKAGNPNGTYEAGNPDYWREISEALAPARAILLFGHGNGKANASHQWVAYAEQHHKDVAAKVIADVRADIDDLSGHQVVGLAHKYFAIQRAWNGG
jgi:hypothetical protein